MLALYYTALIRINFFFNLNLYLTVHPLNDNGDDIINAEKQSK